MKNKLKARQVFPAILLTYDFLFHFQRKTKLLDWLRWHAPFWAILILYFGLRIYGLGTFGYRGTQLTLEDGWNWLIGTWINTLDPFLADSGQTSLFLLLVVPILLVWAVRQRRVIAFGLIWIPLTFIPTVNSITGTSDRSFYIPSLGVVLVIASVFSWLVSNSRRVAKLAAVGGLIVLLIIYSRTLIARNEAFQRAGAIAQAIPLQVKAMHPTLPEDARLVFVGVPDRVSEGILVYLTGFQGSMELAYPSSKFQSWKFDKFPIWFDGLDRTYFFEVNHRRVTERADLVQQLEERKACSNTLEPILTWDFAHDTQGWEAWNDLSELQIRDRALTTVAQGKDPYIGSPTVDIPSIIMDSVEIEMRVQSEQPAAEGQLYWRVSGQQDFSPGLRISFQVQADGTFRTYTINLIERGMLLMDTRIEQFRLDPVDVPAQIEVKAVRVLSPYRANAESGDTCKR